MTGIRAADVFRRIDALEYAWCLRFNRACRKSAVRQSFAMISRLGDGVFWYTIVVLLPILYGEQGARASIRITVVGILGLLLYRWLKGRLLRERPCVSLIGIERGAAPLDRYSFPSGHTLHAVSFSILIIAGFPELGWICAPFAALVAASRVVLGLHYPTDVAAGAFIGAMLAWGSMLIAPLA